MSTPELPSNFPTTVEELEEIKRVAWGEGYAVGCLAEKALREALIVICDQFAATNAEMGRQAKAKGFDTAWVYFGMAKEISTLKAELLFALSSVGRRGANK